MAKKKNTMTFTGDDHMPESLNKIKGERLSLEMAKKKNTMTFIGDDHMHESFDEIE